MRTRIWKPELCPSVEPCWVLIDGRCGEGKLVGFLLQCGYHRRIRELVGDDAATYDAMVQTMFAIEAAREASRKALRLNNPKIKIPFRREPDGTIILGVDDRGKLMPQWRSQSREIISIYVKSAVADIRQPAGTSPLRIA